MEVIEAILIFALVVYTPYIASALYYLRKGSMKLALCILSLALLLTLPSALIPIVPASLASIALIGFLAASRLEHMTRWPILWGFFIAGIVSGLVTVLFWFDSSDLSFYYNLPAVLLGDYLYELSIATIGDPTSSYAHYTHTTPP
ncbi:hypothetical protein [Aeropyrum camini]|uniref:hypothetical protein n=1 Tax=Aeropyrum camini TaxID=229980 RepID=UPI0007881E0B|nr:hypothetical protein [Aeropyrum camini]